MAYFGSAAASDLLLQPACVLEFAWVLNRWIGVLLCERAEGAREVVAATVVVAATGRDSVAVGG